MDKLEIVNHVLEQIGIPPAQRTTINCLSLLALAGIKKEGAFRDATNGWIRIHDIMAFISAEYEIAYAENTRETIRKNAMHNFRTAAVIEDNGLSTNSPRYSYRVTDEFLKVIRTVRETETGMEYEDGGVRLREFVSRHPSLMEIYASKKRMEKMPVRINSQDFTFSPGKHNQLQKAIIEEFAPRFAPNSECLYVGDTTKKDLVKNVRKLRELGFEITLHDKMPDVVLYREDKDWIYFVESVTSVGPMDPKRLVEIRQMTEKVTAGMIYVTAFLDFGTFKKFSAKLAWETEVWIAEEPEHMIHLNGDKFLGPR